MNFWIAIAAVNFVFWDMVHLFGRLRRKKE
jgi:hypothetical protein